jgi:hypothetical protein
MGIERMWRDEFLQNISDELLATQETLEVVEEAVEHELERQLDRQQWAGLAGIPFQANDLEGAKLLAVKVDEALADLACVQEDICSELDITPE